MDITQRIVDVLNEHDIDDYADDDGTTGIHCLKCGWKGTTQREANAHLAEMLVSELGLEKCFLDLFDGTRTAYWQTKSEKVDRPPLTDGQVETLRCELDGLRRSRLT